MIRRHIEIKFENQLFKLSFYEENILIHTSHYHINVKDDIIEMARVISEW